MPRQTRLPEPLLDRLETQIGASKLSGVLKAFEQKRDATFRVNTLKQTSHGVMDQLREYQIRFERIKSIPNAFRVFGISEKKLLSLPLFVNGEAYLQGEASMTPVLALDPQPSETVLDLCAAPGSKTTQIAAMMQNTGELVACEVNEIRAKKLEHNLRLQGVANTKLLFEDGTLLHKAYPETFDRVLADVPCSAEGRIHLEDPRSYRFWSQKNVIAHAKLQRRLLRSASACLKSGGRLVYSTCTLAPEENERMADWAVTELPLALVEKPVLILPTKEREGFFYAIFTRA